MFTKIKSLAHEWHEFKKYHQVSPYITGMSFAQNYEDIIFKRICTMDNIFYVDVGAYDPVRFSNTYLIYNSGGHGINIDPLPSCIRRFNRYRPRDINLNIGVADTPREIEYYDFLEPAFNTINPDRAKLVLEKGYSSLREKRLIQIDCLRNIFDVHVKQQEIDLLTIDVETMELSVLQSNDWDRWRPRFIIMESLVSIAESLDLIYERDPAIRYLSDIGYVVMAKVGNAVFLRKLF